MKTKARKFIDKDVVGFAAFDNGVVLKVNQNDDTMLTVIFHILLMTHQ